MESIGNGTFGVGGEDLNSPSTTSENHQPPPAALNDEEFGTLMNAATPFRPFEVREEIPIGTSWAITKEEPPQKKTWIQLALLHVQHPSIPVVTALVSILSLVAIAVCISVISETLYHRTLSSFAQTALNSITSRVVHENSQVLAQALSAIDTIFYSVSIVERSIPSLEDPDQEQTGIVRPLGPSVANESTGPFIYNLGSKIPNSSLIINTWRDFFGSQLTSMHIANRQFERLEVTFADGAFIQSAQDETNSASLVLNDGVLLTNTSDPAIKYYYLRRTEVVSSAMAVLGYRTSTIIPTSLPDRRNESWYKFPINKDIFGTNEWQRRFTNIYFNASTGNAWVDVVCGLDTRSGVFLGRARVSYSIAPLSALFVSEFFKEWTVLPKAKIYTVALGTETIVAAEAFSDDPTRAIATTIVDSTYQLTDDELVTNCILDLIPSEPNSRRKLCRHTVTTYGDNLLRTALDTVLPKFNFASFAYAKSSQGLSFSNYLTVPFYESFRFEGGSYFVSASPSIAAVLYGPQWITLSIVHESEVTAVLTDTRNIVVIATVCITVFVSLLVAVGAKYMFGPVTNIARLMLIGAYLNDNESSQQTDIDVDRTLSRWAEVRAIQSSYWLMSDELQTLKAYIPEHLREEVIASKRKKSGRLSPSSSEGFISLGKGPATLALSDVHAVIPPSVVANPLEADPSQQVDNAPIIPMIHSSQTIASPETPATATERQQLLSSPSGDVVPFANTFKGHGSSTSSAPNKNKNTGEIQKVAGAEHQVRASTQQLPTSNPLNTNRRDAPAVVVREDNPVFFADSCLIDRDITVVHLNIIGFHQYARRRHPTTISSDYAEFITYISAEAKRFGGVLESFFGDKIWVSFNATSKCVAHQVSACYFAYHVTQVANNTAMRFQKAMPSENGPEGGRGEKPTIDKRFAICLSGINCGVSTGRAFVGPIGNSSIKRHTIISNAVTEAVALERMSLHYAGCNAIIAGDLFPHIDGYCQYMALDATLLPGSQGKRRLIACLAGPMLGETAAQSLTIKRWLEPRGDGFVYPVERPAVTEASPHLEKNPTKNNNNNFPNDRASRRTSAVEQQKLFVYRTVPNTNKFAVVNSGFKAILSGQVEEAKRYLKSMKSQITNKGNSDSPVEFGERKAMISFMINLVQAFMDNSVDGKNYTSALGDKYAPFVRLLLFATDQDQ